ncbi:hypothetical protein BDR05DRAFT_970106 [Suillus weaverae]|nr:hypothetical protein BDR05DRAFT_970106 [Suillus weaverae]
MHDLLHELLKKPTSLTQASDLDRTNVGNARPMGLAWDTLEGDTTGIQFDLVNSAFYYIYSLSSPNHSIVEALQLRVRVGAQAEMWVR